MSLFGAFADRFKDGLRRSRQLFDDGLDTLLSVGRTVDEPLLEELEEMLVAADVGAATAAEFVDRIRGEAKRGRVSTAQDVRALLRRLFEETLAPAAAPLNLSGRPAVVLMLGVNGA